jgi:hypothetical protein
MFGFPDVKNGAIPVMGSVNRRWAEQVLDLWQGAERT